jgi:hypothetical protein
MIENIDFVKGVQFALGLLDVHVLRIDLGEGFSLAHTDAERNSGMNLHDCVVHRTLTGATTWRDGYFQDPGWYKISLPSGGVERLEL